METVRNPLRSLRYALLDSALGRGLLPDPVLVAGSRAGARECARADVRGVGRRLVRTQSACVHRDG